MLAIGAPGVAVGARIQQGALYVFGRSRGLWHQERRLVAANGVALDDLGASVALDRDTLVVGAPYYRVNSGAVYTYARRGGRWRPEQELTVSVFEAELGMSVAVSGDLLVAGATGPEIGYKPYHGVVYVYVRSASR